MRRILLATLVLAPLLLAVQMTSAVEGAGPNTDSVTAGGNHFNFQVTSGPSGENASGRLIITYTGGDYIRADLVGLSASNNIAGIGGVITESSLPNAIGHTVIIVAQDNDPSSGHDDMLLMGTLPPGFVDPMNCATFVATYGQFMTPVDKGNVVVSDAQP